MMSEAMIKPGPAKPRNTNRPKTYKKRDRTTAKPCSMYLKDHCSICNNLMGMNRFGICKSCRSTECVCCKKKFTQLKILTRLCPDCTNTRQGQAAQFPEGAI
jgi:hypothetical protein